jgi:serine/threonine protein phosphatase PrpC
MLGGAHDMAGGVRYVEQKVEPWDVDDSSCNGYVVCRDVSPRGSTAADGCCVSSPAPSVLNVAIRSDTGLVRTNNEDSFGQASLVDGSLFIIVADGMGGHAAGEVASRLAVDVVGQQVQVDPSGDPRARLFHAILEANNAIIQEGKRIGRRGMGTTAITTIIRGQEAFLGQVGDSRLFHVRHGVVMWRTLDHTRVQSLLRRGIINEEEARNHPDAGMLTRALGHAKTSSGAPMEPEVLQEAIQLLPGDALVLSSDGLHDLVDDWEIGVTVAGATPEDAADALVSMALQRGGHDNVTVAVVVVGDRSYPYEPGVVTPDPAADSAESGGAAGVDEPVVAPEDGSNSEASPAPSETSTTRSGGWLSPGDVAEQSHGAGADPRWVWVMAAVGVMLMVLSLLMLLIALALARG